MTDYPARSYWRSLREGLHLAELEEAREEIVALRHENEQLRARIDDLEREQVAKCPRPHWGPAPPEDPANDW